MSRLDTLPAGAQEWRLGMGNASTSPGLPSDFTRVGYTSGDEQYPDSTLQVDTARAAGSYYYTTAPGGDFTAYMSCSVLLGSSMFGIIAVDSSGNGVAAGIYNGGAPNTALVATVAAGAYNSTFAGSKGSLGSAVASGAKIWLKINRTGNAFKMAASINGQWWTPWTSTVTDSTHTLTRVGFGSFFNTPDAFVVESFGLA